VVVREAEPARETAHEAPVSSFLSKLRKQFVISVELDPPRGTNPQKLLAGARKLKAAGTDAVNVADSPMARVRLACWSISALIVREVGLEVIMHFTCRDRNLMGLQSDLMGAYALGVRNIMAVTGDPPRLGDFAEATAVYDVDSIGLVQIIRALNSGTDFAQNAIGKPTELSIGVAVNPAAEDWDRERERFLRKIEAGAQFAFTQPLYEMSILERFLERTEDIDLPVCLGILPLMSHRHAEFLHHEVPGIEVPDAARDAMAKAGKDGGAVGKELALELLERAHALVDGAYLMPSFGRYETCVSIVERLRQDIEPLD
jgi:homocysteine S-methyltransferase